jgi:hypothetical protein
MHVFKYFRDRFKPQVLSQAHGAALLRRGWTAFFLSKFLMFFLVCLAVEPFAPGNSFRDFLFWVFLIPDCILSLYLAAFIFVGTWKALRIIPFILVRIPIFVLLSLAQAYLIVVFVFMGTVMGIYLIVSGKT